MENKAIAGYALGVNIVDKYDEKLHQFTIVSD